MTITSAYNFVPLSSEVFHPDWADQVSHDVPMVDGFCGTLLLTLKNHTPILPGQSRDAVTEHFQLPDGRLAIPGATLRGMIRSVLEIASFGKMSRVDDTRYSIRDLTAGARQVYGDKFTTNHSVSRRNRPQQGPFESKSLAGWLFFDSGASEWKIRPCEYARVDTDELDRQSDGRWNSFRRAGLSGPTATDKYQWWKVNGIAGAEKLSFDFSESGLVDHKHAPVNGLNKFLRYNKASNLVPGNTGRLVFTGQPSNKKHLEFLFHSDNNDCLSVQPTVMRGFMGIYGNQSDSQSNASSHHEYLKQEARSGCFQDKGIPVFYLLENAQVSSLGLSMMYKLPYKYSIGEMIDLSSADHREQNKLDFCELLFGRVAESAEIDVAADSISALKGRVDFSVAVTDTTYRNETEFRTILNGPKPTYYPSYIEQSPAKNDNGLLLAGEHYRTMMDEQSRLRGWKRYPVSADHDIPRPQEGQGENVVTTLKPLNSNAEYAAKLRFHNLNAEELGALVWSITWGCNPSLRHSVGMGKPFGLGQISISIDESASRIIPNNLCHSENRPTLEELSNRFECLMNVRIQNWKETDQIKQLLAMADPALGDRRQLVAMDLSSGRGNEFVLAKGGKGSSKCILAPHGERGNVARKVVDESERWLEDKIDELINKNANAKRREIVFGKALATEWSNLDQEPLKTQVLEQVIKFWEEDDDWHGSHQGKSRKAAYKIYTQTDSSEVG